MSDELEPAQNSESEINAADCKNLNLAFKQLDLAVSAELKEDLKNCPPEELYKYHFDLGLWIRANFDLWKDPPLAESLRKLHPTSSWHPDDLSILLIEDYCKYLNQNNLLSQLRERVLNFLG